MDTPRLSAETNPSSCEDVQIHVRIGSDGSLHINQSNVRQGELASRIRNIMQYRAERNIYLHPDPSMDFGLYAQTLAALNGSIDNLHVVVIAGAIQDQLTKEHLFPCELRLQQATLAAMPVPAKNSFP